MRTVLLGVAMLAAAPAVAAPPAWVGRYVYEQSLGRGPGGDHPFIGHKLTLGAHGCSLRTEGFQTYEHIRCDAIPSPGGLTIAFFGYDDRDPDANYLTIRKYRIGEPLFRLTRSGRTITTRWMGYARAPDTGPRAGLYFRRY